LSYTEKIALNKVVKRNKKEKIKKEKKKKKRKERRMKIVLQGIECRTVCQRHEKGVTSYNDVGVGHYAKL